MIIQEFRYLTTDDIYDLKYEAWSRIYEYPFVLNSLKKLGATQHSKIHNSSWGYMGCHVTFKNDLDNLYPNTIHSDIQSSKLRNTISYDITKEPYESLIEQFDFVLNVSTVEEVKFSHVKVVENLLKQVKNNGYLIITFDYNFKSPKNSSSIQLQEIEKHFDIKLQDSRNKISGLNSAITQARNQNLNCGVLIIQKK